MPASVGFAFGAKNVVGDQWSVVSESRQNYAKGFAGHGTTADFLRVVFGSEALRESAKMAGCGLRARADVCLRFGGAGAIV